MFAFVVTLALAAACSAQYKGHPETAAILSDSRYLGGDGTFGSAYTQEDGVQFKEESDANGNRKGSYSYVDPSGQRRTVTYTAGKDGFRAFGDHLPVPPPAPPTQAPVAPQPQYQPHYQPNQQYYQPQPRYSAPSRPAYNPPTGYDDGQYREEYDNPNYQPENSRQVPAPSPQYSYSFGPTPASVAYAAAGISPHFPAAPAAAPPHQFPVAEPSSHRFLAPGRLNLNRTPDGFSYTFNKS